MSSRFLVASKRGLTLVELMVAVIMVAVIMLLAGRFVVGLIQQVSVSESHTQANEFALEELERIRVLDPDSIKQVPVQPLPYAPAFRRSVIVSDVGGGITDLYHYRIVTVTVEPPPGLEPVSVSTVIARE